MNFIYSITPDGWISFIGIIVGFIGVIITIKHTKKQSEDDKKTSVKPYLDIKLENLFNSTNSFDFITTNKLKNLNLYDKSSIGIEIGNLGQGNCLECKLIAIRIDGRKVNKGLNLGSIKVDKNTLREVTFKTYYGDILNEVNEEFIGKNIKDCPAEFENGTYKYHLNQIEMEFEYKDVLDNKYSKNIVIDVFIIFNIILGESPFFKVSSIEFNKVLYEINETLTTEKPIKTRKKP